MIRISSISRKSVSELESNGTGPEQKPQLMLSPAGERDVGSAAFPLADDIQTRIPIYSASKLLPLIRGSHQQRDQVLDEVHRALSVGPGVLVIRDLLDKSTVDRAVVITEYLEQREAKAVNQSGASDRVFAWTEKVAVFDPEAYADYFGNDLLWVQAS